MKPDVPKTMLYKYLRKEKRNALLFIGLSIICFGVILAVDPKSFLVAFGLFLLSVVYAMEMLQNASRMALVFQTEIAKAFHEAINGNYEQLVLFWQDYNVKEADRVGAKWTGILEVAKTLLDHDLISKEIYDLMMERKIIYDASETKIRLENMRSK